MYIFSPFIQMLQVMYHMKNKNALLALKIAFIRLKKENQGREQYILLVPWAHKTEIWFWSSLNFFTADCKEASIQNMTL